jgi:ABC-type proline/glycine betaine transport system ATPase subunit
MHGLAGSGKSTLIQHFATAESIPDGAVIVLDCREI